MKQIIIFVLTFIPFTAKAQVEKESNLFVELKKQDSIFFERSFNQCDLAYLENHISPDLKFYHDQSGFQDKEVFFENTRKYVCPDLEKKPIRKVEVNSLEVFPLYNNGELYGAIQKGVHRFYLREKSKKDVWTSTAKFTHVWVLKNGIWKLSDALSYDHQDPLVENSTNNIEK